ncbi:tRNA (guanine(46)-N(7))-methyltransferase TrmB [Kordiimonas aquimaris]|uniref:tRNA (guanine(46)-N(7))-methyltransferase TrmB n=1 Tax=Kordiimonas aquimaris TaxID=707591 RepID=UPI0021D20323|nr:tRNA (guanine(46)-N(7))-methyltransferase TrmB [Kordiimonas aquimaris]
MASEEKSFLRPEHRFFGRRKGPALSDRKQSLIDDFLPTISVPIEDPTSDQIVLLNLDELFPQKPRAIWLEIGFGKGEHLAWQATNNADVGHIGCEPYMNGVAGLLSHLYDNKIDNVRVYGDDARHVIKRLPDASVERVFLLHPDPWPKRRHARRRFVNRFNLNELARILVDGGEFRVGTDHPIYREWTALQMANRDDFEWLAAGPDDWLVRPDDWPETRYEAKALEGHATYFRFKRMPRSVSKTAA